VDGQVGDLLHDRSFKMKPGQIILIGFACHRTDACLQAAKNIVSTALAWSLRVI
jgi:hypothetical protein